MKTVAVKLQTTKVLGPNNEIIEASLDDMIKSIRLATEKRDFVEGGTNFTRTIRPTVKGILQSACIATIELLQKGKDNGGIDTDKYNLLTSNTRSFKTKNGIINKILKELAAERLLEEQKKPVEPEKPLSAEEEAKLISEPKPHDENTHSVDVTTTDGGTFTFDKVNYKLTLHFTDKTMAPKVIDLTPKGSWRETALNWLVSAYNYVRDKTVSAGKAIGRFFSRLNPFKIKDDTPIPDDYDENGNPIFADKPPIAKGEEKPEVKADEAKVEEPTPQETNAEDTGTADQTKPDDKSVVATA